MKIISIILLLCSNLFLAQKITEIDSVSRKLCYEIEHSDENLSSSERLQKSFENIASPFLNNYDKTLREEITTSIFYRLQRVGCLKFFELYNDINQQSGSMKRSSKMPNSDISKQQLKKFKKLSNFSYMENDGTNTQVILSKNSWNSKFSDGSFSKYILTWLNPSEFEIEYVDSNNEVRKKMNIIGDKYHYKIISYNKNNKYFTLVEYIPNTSKFAEFKLNFIK